MNDQALDETKVQELIGYLKVGLIVAVLLAVASAGYFFIENRHEEKSRQAFSALFQAEKIEESAAKEAGALKTDVTEQVLKWPEAKRKELTEAYLKVAHEHSGTVAALSGLLRAARWNFLEKNFTE